MRSDEYYRWEALIGYSILLGIVLGILLHIWSQPLVYVNEVEARGVEEVEVEVKLEVVYDAAGIEKLIRRTFVEEPNTAVAVVKAEGGLRTEIQSHFVKDGIQEPSYCAFQIHAPSWDKAAKKLGFGDYRTNVEHCVNMAYHIYKQHGWYPWSAYKNGSYKKFL